MYDCLFCGLLVSFFISFSRTTTSIDFFLCEVKLDFILPHMAEPDDSKGAGIEADMRDESKTNNAKDESGKQENETRHESAQNYSSPKRNVSEGANGIDEMHIDSGGSGDHRVGEKNVAVEDDILTADVDDSRLAHDAIGIEENGSERLEDVSTMLDDMDTDTTKDKLASRNVKSTTANETNDGDNPHVENVAGVQTSVVDSVDSGGNEERSRKSCDLQAGSETARREQSPVGMEHRDLSKQGETKKSFNENGPSCAVDTMEGGSEHEGDEKVNNSELQNSKNENDEEGKDGDEKGDREKDESGNEKDVNGGDGTGDGGGVKENGHESPSNDMENLRDVRIKDGDKNDIEDDAAGIDEDEGVDDDDPFAGLEDIATLDLYEIGHYTFGKKDSVSRCKALSDMSGRTVCEKLRRAYTQRGMRRSVGGVMLVHEHNFPHVLLLQRSDGKGEFILPGGRLRPGESFEQGLERKLKSKLGRPDMSDEDDSDGCLEVGDKRKMNALKFFLGLLLCVID